MNILVPVDGTEHSLRAVEFLTTRTDLLGAAPKITIFFSQHPVPQRMITSLEPLTIKDYYAEEAESLFASVRALLGDTKLNIEMHYAVGSPAEEIVKEADLVDADLIIMGIRGHSAVSSFLFGSVSNAVLAHTHRPILMLRDKLPEGTSLLRIGIACDGSEYGERAVDFVLKNRALLRNPLRASQRGSLHPYDRPLLDGKHDVESDGRRRHGQASRPALRRSDGRPHAQVRGRRHQAAPRAP